MIDSKEFDRQVEELIKNKPGTVCRAFRHALGLTQLDVADIIECSGCSISRAEKDDPHYERWTNKMLDFFVELTDALDEEDKEEIGAVVGVELCVKPKTLLLGMKYKRRTLK